MSQTVQIWEVCAAAETRVEDLFDRTLDRLHAYNTRLAQLRDLIRTTQPMASGSVCLELYACGKTVCRGCPHARWVQYIWTPGRGGAPDVLKSINLSSKKANPSQFLKRKSAHYKATADLIKEAKDIISARARLVSALRPLDYAASAGGSIDE